VTEPRSQLPPQPHRASYTLHVASVAGLDREGAKTFPARQLELVRLLDEVLDLFDSEPRFQHFTLDGQSILIEDYLSIRPEHFERVELAVQEGKLLIGPWYIRPESVFASSESLIRNLLIGLRTARVFGRPMLVGYVPNAMALPGQWPQILKGFGIDTVITRGAADQPAELRWEGDDGTPLIVGQVGDQSQIAPGVPVAAARQKLVPYSASGHLLLLYAWNMRLPLKQRLDYLKSLAQIQVELHDSIFHSHPAAYAQAIHTYAKANPLPTVHGQLDATADNDDPVLDDTAGRSIARRCAEAERLLVEVIEPRAVWAEYQNAEVGEGFICRPQTFIQRLWRDLLINQSRIRGDSGDSGEIGSRYDRIEQVAGMLKRSQPAPDNPDEPWAARLVACSGAGFRLTAVKLPEDSDRNGMIVRGHNVGGESNWVTLTPWRPFATVEVVTVDEAPTGGKLAPESNGAVRFRVGPHRVLTFWFHD
jgi:hypothetical protein